MVAGITSLIGIHLSFYTYTVLTSMMAGLANPLFFVPVIAGGGAWMASKANRSIRGTLYPTLVAMSVLAHAANEDRERSVAAFRERLAALVTDINSATGARQVSLVRRFPGLGNPPRSARIARHVGV